jgi:hypothetical protein
VCTIYSEGFSYYAQETVTSVPGTDYIVDTCTYESETIDTESWVYAVLNPDEDKRSYSTVHGSDAVGTGHARSMLSSVQAWSVGSND